MLNSKDKDIKALKQSHLMQVAEFHKMVLALERFKEELAVKAITGKKNIRTQKTPDRIFFSVLEKMLLEVSSFSQDMSFHKAEQQLLSLRKVFLWFESNKHVLMKSDGYFKAARKITEDIYEKQLRSRLKRGKIQSQKEKSNAVGLSSLKTIDVHLSKLHQAEKDSENKQFRSDTSMFARSPTQDLTSIDSVTIDERGNYEEDLYFAREIYDHEYMGGNKIERLNRPMTAPLKLKPGAQPPFRSKTETPTEVSFHSLRSQELVKARPQSALTQVHHDLSWAKTSPLPLAVLVRKNAGLDDKKEVSDTKKATKSETDAESAAGDIPAKPQTKPPVPITDGKKIANLVMFKQFCLEHSAQQENYMRQYTHHKHGTRQHFLEFPENSTENIVRQTANVLYNNNHEPSGTQSNVVEKMGAYKGMSLEEFLDRGVSQPPQGTSAQHQKENKTPHTISVSSCSNSKQINSNHQKVPHPPTNEHHAVVQPSQNPVKLSSVYELAAGTGKRMNTATEQALSAPKHGWRYPMVPISSSGPPEVSKTSVSGVVLALQQDDFVQHRVLIPLTPNSNEAPPVLVQDQGVQTHFIYDDDADLDVRPKSSFTMIADGKGSTSSPSRPSTRPWSSPRYITEVRTIMRNRAIGSRSCFDMRPDLEYGDHVTQQRSLRSAGTGSPNRPRTAASWGSYPHKSEVSRSVGAASHHSTGVLRHRSVAETMRVKSVNKRLSRGISGRSSASSYVAQLREKKRAGAKINAQTKPGGKRAMEYEQMIAMDDEQLKPHLSFIQIASPMHVPTDTTVRTYARPGGVYCGSTAAVAVASEGQVNIMDEAMSDGHLSYEELYMNTPADELDDKDDKDADDNWLSQWLSGGPLDGLQDTANGIGKATTYADIVSRAAIIGSSDERSYSEEAPASTSAVGGMDTSPRENISLSLKEDFSISPRTDPLISHRTTTTSTSGVGGEDEIGFQQMDTIEDQQEDDVRSSGRVSSELSSSLKASDLSTGYSADEEEDDMKVSGSEELNTQINPEQEELQKEDSDSKVLNEDDQKTIEQPTVLEENAHEKAAITDAAESRHHVAESADFDERLNSVHNLRNGRKGDEDSQKTEEISQNSEVEQKDVSKNDENQPADVSTNEENHHQDETVKASHEDTDRLPDEYSDSGKETEEYSENDSFRSETISSYHSMTESEADMLSDSSPVRIVVTSARKVERELLERHASEDVPETPSPQSEAESAQKVTRPNDVESTQKVTFENDVESVQKVSRQNDFESAEKVTSQNDVESAENVTFQNDVESVQEITRKSVAAQTDGDYVDSETESRMITREDVSGVASLSRPLSGRPIPSEAEVRDPFVDFVASTRQKQVDRAVDVQSIFGGSSDETGRKIDPVLERRREEEQEAAITMQRAYRRYSARLRAVRKCQGLNKETLEWARSYKAMLLEKKEMRKRRLREARQSSRSLQRREAKKMSKIGPHKEVYKIYHPESIFPDVEVVQESAVELQRLVRGWLVRRKLENVRRMVQKRESSISVIVNEYRGLLQRTQTRHGKLKPSLSLTYDELLDYLQQREKYELAFKKREFWNEMESSELNAFFNDCGLFPSQDEVAEAVESVTKSLDSLSSKKKKHSATALTREDVIEIAFYIYIPAGARMENQNTRSSTWLTPIHEGEEGLKLIGSELDEKDEVENADFQVVSRFVAQVFKERKESKD